MLELGDNLDRVDNDVRSRLHDPLNALGFLDHFFELVIVGYGQREAAHGLAAGDGELTTLSPPYLVLSFIIFLNFLYHL